MPVNRIVATKRGKAAIAAALVAVASAAGGVYSALKAQPPAVVLAVDSLIKPWEGKSNTAYRDVIGVPTICYGETRDVKIGMRRTDDECERMLVERVVDDFYEPILKCAPNLKSAPISVQASMLSGAYNFGTGGWCGSSAKRHVDAGRWRQACEAQTAWNKAGGRVIGGLISRREMGDKQRIGEAELCVSGISS